MLAFQVLPAGTDTAGLGDGPFNERALGELRAQCRRLAATNEFAINGHENRISYIVGPGHSYRASICKGVEAPADVALAVQKVVDEFVRENRWQLRQQEIVRRVDRDGEAFLRFFADHEQYLQIGGFRFFALEPMQVRYIQGFGGLHWIAGDGYLAADTAAMVEAEPSVLEHMNADHRDALRDYCRAAHGVDLQDVEMVGVDCDGFDVRADGSLLRFAFEAPVTAPAQLRAVFIELSRKSRGNA